MKGFLALATNRLAALDIRRAARQLALLFTYDEETGTLGARRFTETWPDRDALPRTGHHRRADRAAGGARAQGNAAPPACSSRASRPTRGYPHLGRNAIEPAARAIVALVRAAAADGAERPPHAEQFPDVPFAAAQRRHRRGGSATNVVPDRCEMDLGIRLLPGMAAAAMAARVRDDRARPR